MNTNTLERFEQLSLLQRIMLVVGLTVVGFFLFGAKASAATINVTAGADDDTVNGNCSIHEAVEAARTDSAVDNCVAGSGADTVNLPDGTYSLSTTFIDLDLGDESITLNGSSRDGTIIDGGGYGMEYIAGVGVITISVSNLTVRNSTGLNSNGQTAANVTINNTVWHDNDVSGSNAIIDVDGDSSGIFTLTDSILRDNTGLLTNTIGSSSGFNSAVLDNVEIYDNVHASGNNENLMRIRTISSIEFTNIEYYDNEGGVDLYATDILTHDVNYYNQQMGAFSIGFNPSGAQLTAYNLAIFNNSGTGALAITSDSGGFDLDLSNITVEGNTTAYPGIFLMGDENDPISGTISNVTIANNNRVGDFGMTIPAGMAVMSNSGIQPTVVISNTLMANNLDEGTPRSCVPAGLPFYDWVSGGGNLSTDNTCTTVHNQSSDQNDVAANIGALTQENDTWVVPLLANSPAVDGGVTLVGITSDQRGVSRPQGTAYDTGAYEFDGEPTTDPDPDPNPDPDPTPSDSGSSTGNQASGDSNQLANTGMSVVFIIVAALGLIAGAVIVWLKSRGQLMAIYRLHR